MRLSPADCPSWDYSAHPSRVPVLALAVKKLLLELRGGQLDAKACVPDPRAPHSRLFRDLTPPGHEYYAGHYRGEQFRCLQYYDVMVPGDPSVGFPANSVVDAMDRLAREFLAAIDGHDVAANLPSSQLSPKERLKYAVATACTMFVQFLEVHPFADGNGHTGRFIVWAFLGRYGWWPERWAIEPRPIDPPYTDLIQSYRERRTHDLEACVLQAILG